MTLERLHVSYQKFKKTVFIEFLFHRSNHTIAGFLKRPQGTNDELFKEQKSMNDILGQIKIIEEKKAEMEKKAAEGMGVAEICETNELQQLLSSDNTELNQDQVMTKAVVLKALNR